MANTFEAASEHTPNEKRNKEVLAAVAQEILSNEDDDVIVDAVDICDIMENHKQSISSKAIYALGETIRNTLLEINETREQNRERRHKELLEILTKIVHHDTATSKCDLSHKGKIFKHQAGEDEQHIAEQYTIIEELTTEPIVDKEIRNSTSNSTIINMRSSADCNDTMIYKLNERPLSPLNNVTMNVAKKQSQSELEKMRAQMLEMQRKKMEDRVRKKRGF